MSAIIKISHDPVEVTGQVHRYGLKADLTSQTKHDGFRLEILWPYHVPITSHQSFEEEDEQDIDGTRYLPLMLYSDKIIAADQNLQVIGTGSDAFLVYEIDKEIARLIKATSLNLYYKLYLSHDLPVEGEMPLSELNDFDIN